MDFLKKESDDMIRIVIGNTEHGFKGIKKPTRTITVVDATLEEVYEIIFDALKEKIEDEK